MKEFLKVIYSRQSIRKFGDEAVTNEQMLKILEAGRLAPSGGNSQPWRFVVVQSKEKRDELLKLIYERENIQAQRQIIETASVVIAVLYERETPHGELNAIQAIGAAIENMLLAVHALGLGACWMGHHRDKEIENMLGASKTEELMALVAIGHPTGRPPFRGRKSLDEIARYI